MAKIRVYELAKELGLDNKEILAELRALNILVKTHMSVVPEEDLERVKKSLTEKSDVRASGGMEEKRVAKGVIRRRKAAKPEVESDQELPRMDLESLKLAAKRARKDEQEAASAKPEPEKALDGVPEEWTKEAEADKKKKAAKKAKPAKKAAGKAKPKKKAAKKIKPALRVVEPQEAEEAPKKVKRKATAPAPRKMYLKPTLRKTARAVEGEPLTIPGQEPPPKKVEQVKEAPLKEAVKKKKKRKKGKAAQAEDSAEIFGEVPPKRRLRRKIAFKMQRGTEGMEIADTEQMYLPSRKKITGKKKAAQKTVITTPKAAKRVVRMSETITVAELAKQLGVKSKEILKVLKQEGVAAEENHDLDLESTDTVATEYNYEVSQKVFDEEKILGEPAANTSKKDRPRPPVVTVMGHVDHGKTSLLDIIRKTRVTEEEAGAITQHIGASVVETSSGKITFIDTPGHEAFTSMRARGAKVTDIVVLVVAADDGIMPQTIEAANHAQAADVPIIVAINKIDLPSAKPDSVKQRLSEIGLAPEQWGGKTQTVECSAKSGQGVPDLLDEILAQAEILELTGDPAQPGGGLVIESRLDKGKGPVATILVEDGTLHRGDIILSGTHFGKIRAMLDDRGKPIKEAGPSIPVEIMGLSGVPEPGEKVVSVGSDKKAKMVAEYRLDKQKDEREKAEAPAKVSLEDLMARLEEGEVRDLNVILKTDTHGSSEAIKQAIENLSMEEVRVKAIHVGVGNINENDVLLASASNAVILGFQVKAEGGASKTAEEEGVQIRSYDIIYNLLDDVKASLQGMLKPVFEEQVIGAAEVRKVFRVPRVGAVAGSLVTNGLIRRNANARVLRSSEVIHTGRIKSLRRITEDVKEVNQGLECGITLENFSNFEEGDMIEAYEVTESAPPTS
jgi:translation initiation factor IF-2